jgi:hypothetical protein
MASVAERRIGLSPVSPGRELSLGTCVMVQEAGEEVAECLRLAAEAEARAEATNAKSKAEYRRVATTWRTLGRLGRFIPLNESRKKACFLSFLLPTIKPFRSAEPASRHDADTVLANTPFLLTRCSSDLRYLFVSEAHAKMLGH